MDSPAKAKPEGILGLSAGEAKILILGFLCITDQYKVDYGKLASKGGYTAGSANVLFNKAKRKLLELNPDASTSAENGSSATGAGEASFSKSATTTPKKGQAKRKKAAAGAEDGGADGEEAGTPTKLKRQRKAPAKKGAAAAAKAGADDGENGNNATEAEASKSENMVKTEPMDEGHDGSVLAAIKAELDEVMDDADLDAELQALDAAQRDVKAEDDTA